jgi:O-methyltransferase
MHSKSEMFKQLIQAFRKLPRALGIDLVRFPPAEAIPPDLSPEMLTILKHARPHTLTTLHRMASTQDAIRYVVKAGIPGDIVECGVWRGGNMAVAASTLLAIGAASRELFLYDTYEGMTPPTEKDTDYSGGFAADYLNSQVRGTGVWCEASIEDVGEVMRCTDYPTEKVHLIKGPVEQTIPANIPSQIAVLRLDTDWYESTMHELVHLYPRLMPGGVLIIDDYGHWRGARQAVDEYFEKHAIHSLLNRVDYTCRIMLKPI